MTKKELRKLIYARRKAATDEQVVTASRQINEKIYATEAYQKAGSVFTYMDYKHEVMTRDFIEQAWKDGKRVAVPRVTGDIMHFYYITSFDQLESGCMGIMEPVVSAVECADDDEKALFILPGVAFDPACHRCGYGGGFYDKYQEIHTQHETIAVAFDFQIVEEVPSEPTDICPMHVFTESTIYSRS